MRLMVAGALLAASSFAQQSAQDAFDRIQAMRDKGRRLQAGPDPRLALPEFEAALAYLRQPLVQDLARGDLFLENRYLNLCIDFAETYARVGENAKAIDWLEKALNAGGFDGFAGYLERNPPYVGLQKEPALQALVARARQVRDYWEPPALRTPYRDVLPDAEKIAGLSKFWSEVKYNFAYPERLLEIDWDRQYLEAIPKVLAAKATADYYRELMRLCGVIADGHTNVYPPRELKIGAKPPMKTLLIEGRVGVAGVYAKSLSDLGLRPGMEILAVDGENVHGYVKREIAPFVSAATPQDRALHEYSYAFLRGAEAEPVTLKLRSPEGDVVDLKLARIGYQGAEYPSRFEYRTLPGNVAYVRVDTFADNAVVGQWKEKFAEIRQAGALVLDLRSNGGGSSDIGWAILSDLIEQPTLGAMTRLRRYVPTERAWGQKQVQFASRAPARVEPGAGPRFEGPVLVLTGGATYSAAEDFLIAFRHSKRGRIVGEASGGSTGQPLMISLPGGGSARICTKQDLMPDGAKWVGVGIRPDVEVKPQWKDFIAGRDTVLEAALGLLRK